MKVQADRYHVHVYFENSQHSIAEAVRDKMLKELPEIEGAGTLRSRAIGPHPTPMFEAWFESKDLNQIVEWIKNNRNGLSVMFHPLTGNDLDDHKIHAFWIGESLPLRLEVFR